MSEITPDVIVCMDANAPFAVRGCDFSHCCVTCGRRVMIAPSGQRVLVQWPEISILCVECFRSIPGIEETVKSITFTEPGELATEMQGFGPNLFGRRN
jgi:hypothetical protein